MIRVVLDTNVVVSRYLSRSGPPAEILRRWEAGVFDLIVSVGLLAEYRRVFAYPRLVALHHLSPSDIAMVIDAFRLNGIDAGDPPVVPHIPDDPDDDIIIACALAGRADVIVSGDRHLLALGRVEGIEVMPPAAFLRVLDADDMRG